MWHSNPDNRGILTAGQRVGVAWIMVTISCKPLSDKSLEIHSKTVGNETYLLWCVQDHSPGQYTHTTSAFNLLFSNSAVDMLLLELNNNVILCAESMVE